MPLDLSSLEQALSAFGAVLAKSEEEEFMQSLDPVAQNAIQAGVIQHFEFSYELCWKFMKRWLENNLSPGIADGVSRRELFRLARENRLISDVDTWMQYHFARNETSHSYASEVADRVYQAAQGFQKDAEAFLVELKKRNG